MQSMPNSRAISGPDPGLGVMEGRQAVHELGMRVAGSRHHLLGHAVGFEQAYALRPFLLRLAHRQPNVGAQAHQDGLAGNRIRGAADPQPEFTR
jgi:hypothetical protein